MKYQLGITLKRDKKPNVTIYADTDLEGAVSLCRLLGAKPPTGNEPSFTFLACCSAMDINLVSTLPAFSTQGD